MGYYCIRNQLAVEPEVVMSPGGQIHSSENRILLSALICTGDSEMELYGEQHGFVIKTFFKNGDPVIATQRAFRTHFQVGRRAV